MYEMEGPRLPAALVSRLLGDRWLPAATGVSTPALRAGCPALPAVPGCPGRLPSSVV